MSPPVLARLLDGRPLRPADIAATFDRLVDPTATDVERAAILVAIEARSLSVPEIVAFARCLRSRAVRFPTPAGSRAIDLCGSGGAPRPSFNVSTVSAFVVAAAGVPVVKHGNRSARGLCGSSDLLEALGLPVTRSRSFARATYRRHGLAFLHAPLFHPATAVVGPARRALGVPTIFNRLGPLANPAAVPFQVAGAYDAPTAEMFSRALVRLGVRRGMSMWSADGCDEFSPLARTHVIRWDGPRRARMEVRPADYLAADDRRGAWGALTPPAAAAEAERIFAGGGGARRGSVLLTSGAALWTAGAARSLADGIRRAEEALDSGRAATRLDGLRALAGRFPEGGT